MIYKHILLASDLSKFSKHVGERAKKLAKMFDAKLSLVHAIEMIPAYSYAYMGLTELEENLIKEAKQSVHNFAKELHLLQDDCWIEIGHTKIVILDVAEKCKADLIVVGRHGHQHGLSAILGSTANAVLHHAKVDVLTIQY